MVSTTLVLSVLSALLLEATFVSALSVGDSCTDTPHKCDAPLSCVGNPENKKCFKKRSLGMVCGKDPFWVCENGLICDDGICKEGVSVAGSCNGKEEACVPPLSCVGKPGNRKCFMKKGVGKACGKEPFWVCQDGLFCIDGICKEPVGELGACDGIKKECIPPLNCLGFPGSRKCVKKSGLGMACGKRHTFPCADGLICFDTVCRRPVRNPEIFKKMGLGKMCANDPQWECKKGLVCVDNICRRQLGTRGSCNGPGEKCAPPFFCVGKPGKQKCAKRKFRGMTCNENPYSICAPHLVCDDGICKKLVGVRGKCGIDFQICKPPLSCVGTPFLKRCVLKKKVGMTCGKVPFSVCEDGLKCVHFQCRPKH